MTKCGKSVLPECEYFATNGCVSPFNCPYKVENESITTATSTPCNLYPLETDKDKEISRLQAENAELRARLEKAVELPCEVGDTLIIEADKLPEGCVPRFYCSVGGKEIDITEYVHEENFSTEE